MTLSVPLSSAVLEPMDLGSYTANWRKTLNTQTELRGSMARQRQDRRETTQRYKWRMFWRTNSTWTPFAPFTPPRCMVSANHGRCSRNNPSESEGAWFTGGNKPAAPVLRLASPTLRMARLQRLRLRYRNDS